MILDADLASRLSTLTGVEKTILAAIANGDTEVVFKDKPAGIEQCGYMVEQMPKGYRVTWAALKYQDVIMTIKAAKSGGKSRVVLTGFINRTTRDSLSDLGYRFGGDYRVFTVYWDSCPDCGGNTKMQEGGGIACIACSYWECY